MADSLNMGGLSLKDSQHAPSAQPNGFERSTYIPPHMRNRAPPPGPPAGPPAPPAGGPTGPLGPPPGGYDGMAGGPMPQQAYVNFSATVAIS